MLKKLVILVAITVFALVSVSTALAGGDAEAGKAIFDKNCVTCHGKEGKGDGPAAKALKPQPANFHDPERMKKSDDELTNSITNGTKTPEGKPTPMVGWKGKLNEQQIADVLAYIRSFGGH